MISRQQNDWEELAVLDPYWAILSDPSKRFGGWNKQEFFETGEKEIEAVMAAASQLGHPLQFQRALDFGSGLGRLTRSLASRFEECIGIDVSESMVRGAKEINADVPNCRFLTNTRPDLKIVGTNDFDFIYSSIVLQHLPSRDLIRTYIAEFVRVLKPGGLAVFQVLSFLPMKYRLQPTRRLYWLLRNIGFPAQFVYRRLGLYPIRNNYIPASEVVHHIRAVGGNALRTTETDVGLGIRTSTYYVSKEGHQYT